jgi:hypothetical protein
MTTTGDSHVGMARAVNESMGPIAEGQGSGGIRIEREMDVDSA